MCGACVILLVFPMGVVNGGCSDAMKIDLEWGSNNGLEISATDPNGGTVTNYIQATVGVITAQLYRHSLYAGRFYGLYRRSCSVCMCGGVC